MFKRDAPIFLLNRRLFAAWGLLGLQFSMAVLKVLEKNSQKLFLVCLDSEFILCRCKSEVLQEQVTKNIEHQWFFAKKVARMLIVTFLRCPTWWRVWNRSSQTSLNLVTLLLTRCFFIPLNILARIWSLILSSMILRTLPPFRNSFQTTLAPYYTPTTSS